MESSLAETAHGLTGLRRRLARGEDVDVLLAELAGMIVDAVGADCGGIWDLHGFCWHHPQDASASQRQRVARAVASSSATEWVVAVPLSDDGTPLGRLVVIKELRRAAVVATMDLDAAVELAVLLLIARHGGRSPSSALVSPATDAPACDEGLVGELRRDLAAGRLVPHFQPVVELTTGRVDGVEALIRWNHPTRGWLHAGQFLPCALAAGLGPDLGALVVERAANRARRWLDRGMSRIRVDIKVSEIELGDDRFVPLVVEVAARHHLRPSSLGLLLSAGALDAVGPDVARLRQAGVRLGAEHLGTTPTLPPAVRSLPLATMKLDRSVVATLTEPQSRQQARAVLSTAAALGIASVADGVERDDQRNDLAGLGCRSALGFLWSPAVEAEVVDAMLRFQPFARGGPQAVRS